MSSAGSGLIGLSEMFSLKAVDLVMLLAEWRGPIPSNGSVSDLFTRLRTDGWLLVSADMRRLWECFLVDDGGDGSLVFGSKALGSLACEREESIIAGVFLARAGTGRLLNVLLRGIPPIGSSGRHI